MITRVVWSLLRPRMGRSSWTRDGQNWPSRFTRGSTKAGASPAASSIWASRVWERPFAPVGREGSPRSTSPGEGGQRTRKRCRALPCERVLEAVAEQGFEQLCEFFARLEVVAGPVVAEAVL